MDLISKYIKVYVKRNVFLALFCSILVFIPLFICSLIYDVLSYDIAVSFVPFAIAIICVLISLIPTIQFRRMIAQQEKQYGVKFSDAWAVHLETTLYLSDNWLIWAGVSALYRGHISDIQAKTMSGSVGSSNKVKLITADNRRYVVWCLSDNNLKKVYKWLNRSQDTAKAIAALKGNSSKSKSISESEMDLTAFKNGFPDYLSDKASRVISTIRKSKRCPGREDECMDGYNSSSEKYLLSDNSAVSFPYRMYLEDDDALYTDITDIDEKLIFDCIFTRNCNGFVREKHLKNILACDVIPEWCMPYILRLSSEYVVEIVNTIYDGLKGKDNADLTSFCRNNLLICKRAYSRMVSYWDCYYRRDWIKLRDYVGSKLYRELFLPNTNFEKI